MKELLGWFFYHYVKLQHRHTAAVFGRWSNFTRVKWFPFGLLLKIGRSDVGLEADALRYIRQHTSIPVPRVIASATYGKKAYTLMKRVKGMPLDSVWPDLDDEQRSRVATQLRDVVAQLRQLPPPPHVARGTVGSLHGQAMRDSRISCAYCFGPYSSESEFNDRLIEAADPFMDRGLSEPVREQMRNDHRIVFTHGDLTPRNILIRGDTVMAIVDWEESGWLPEHWELVKARWSPMMERDSGWFEALWEILGREHEADWLVDCELSKYMVGAF
ncbi:kinase-like protein [Fistulina hepatica ATCC 64428]|uniref:Kinase-like protein n=1 Tax=Fistulina hepatica ATCC 64428 TaxID=1128425 RepID=A0A0D7AK82_9AGAR|nr:kinase-like protein [Fistulina hepatica ATCC 64428]